MKELRLPELGENIETADVTSVLVTVGEVVSAEQAVIEVETEKASLEVPADTAGRIAEVRVSPGDKLKVGEVILVVEPADAETSRRKREAKKPARTPAKTAEKKKEKIVEFRSRSSPEPDKLGEPVPAAPSVRALARELGVDIRSVPGGGPGGRITRVDVKAHAKQVIQGRRAAAPAGGPAVRELPDFGEWGEVEREPLSALRRAAARSLAHSWAVVPHVTQFDRADVTQLESMRKRFNERPEAAEHRLSVTALALKVVAAALRRFPRFNASLDLEAGEAVLKRYVHVGVAVDTERGLVVPVLRDVDRKRLLELAAELDGLAARARDGKLGLDEMRGAGFTVSNLGGLGTTYFSPIVNWPEVAILGLGRSELQAVPVEGGFEPRRILPLSLSYDHRWIDGADAARFLRWIAEALEQPLILLLDAPAE